LFNWRLRGRQYTASAHTSRAPDGNADSCYSNSNPYHHEHRDRNPVPCIGDCDNSGQVTIDELLTLVNIALGTAQPSACPEGIPSGVKVDLR